MKYHESSNEHKEVLSEIKHERNNVELNHLIEKINKLIKPTKTVRKKRKLDKITKYL